MVIAGQASLVIVGPTGVGKTALAVELAARRKGHILSADSRQVYRLLDIGTAKATAQEQAQAPHHLIDLAWPDEPLVVADFQRLGLEEMAVLEQAGLPYLIVGGSPFYLYSLLGGFFLPSVGADPVLRAELEKVAEELGNEVLHQRLAAIDPLSAARIHPQDRRRLVRALEVWELTGRPRSSFRPSKVEPGRFRLVGLHMEREAYRRRIAQRTAAMFRGGLLDEVQSILERGFHAELPPLQSIGYREAVLCLHGSISQEVAVEQATTRTLQFAKRQMTWFKRDPQIRWLELESDTDPSFLADAVL